MAAKQSHFPWSSTFVRDAGSCLPVPYLVLSVPLVECVTLVEFESLVGNPTLVELRGAEHQLQSRA